MTRAALGLACALLLTGCASAEVIRLPKAGANVACLTPAVDRDLVVGVALSGGGSRAALFGAAGLEALGRLRTREGGSVLEQVSYLSSVSGGSLAAAYYALHKPPRGTPVLGPDGAMAEAYRTFFAGFRAKLTQDFESALIWRQLSSFRFILNSALAARSLREILDERLLGPATFGDLSARETRGDSPQVIFNTTLYNNGQRFLLTTLPPEELLYDFPADLNRSLASKGTTRTYNHEVMELVFLNQLQDKRVRRALILSFNSSYPFSVGYRILGRRKEPWTLFNYDFSRIPSIMEERATAFWSLFYRSLQAEGVFPDDQTLHIVFLNHTGALWEDDLSDLPEACRTAKPPLTSPEEVQERIAEIPTRARGGVRVRPAVAHHRRRQGGRAEPEGDRGLPGSPPDAGGLRAVRPGGAEQVMRTPVNRMATTVVVFLLAAATALLGGAADAEAKTEIHFWHAMEGQLGEAVEELVKQFNQSQGEFEVKALFKGAYPELLTSAIAAYRHKKNHPHVMQVYEVGTQRMLRSRAVTPVYALMKQQAIAVDWDDFISSSPILYYNKDVFKKVGLGDSPPASWQDVEAASRKILAAGAAKCGFTSPAPSWTMLENTFAWHDQPFATNQNGYTGLDAKLLINSDFGRMHIGALARWHKENIYSSGGPMGRPDPKFIDGDCAMSVQSSAFIGGFKKSLTFDWGTGQLPHWGPPYRKANTIVGGATLWVLQKQKPEDYKGVAQFLKFIAEPPQQMWWAVTTGYVPVTQTAVRTLEDGHFFRRNPEQWTAMSALLNAPPTPNSRGIRLGNFGQVRQVIEQELARIFDGSKTVEDGLDRAAIRGNAILREFAATHKPWPGEI